MGLQSPLLPQIFPKVDLLPIDNDSEKQKVARKTNDFKFLKNVR